MEAGTLGRRRAGPCGGMFSLSGGGALRPGGVLPGQPVCAAHSAAGRSDLHPQRLRTEPGCGALRSGSGDQGDPSGERAGARGALFGAAALFQEREDYATTLTARTPCALLLLPQSLVGRAFLERSPQAAGNYIRYLSGRIRFLSDRLGRPSGRGAPSAVWPFTSWSGRRTAGSCWESRLRRWPSGSM